MEMCAFGLNEPKFTIFQPIFWFVHMYKRSWDLSSLSPERQWRLGQSRESYTIHLRVFQFENNYPV